ncbi:MAG: hypothetical protein Q9M43_14340 [Sulfurimonas sp.]|nr:hypothetical protein [Sulfurimonas sp.]
MKKLLSLSLVASSLLLAGTDLDLLKAQMDKQQLIIEKLQAQIKILAQKDLVIEQDIKTVSIQSTKKSEQSVNTSASSSQNANLLDMALVLNMSMLSRNVNNTDYAAYAIPGFVDAPSVPVIPFNPNRGFNLNYAEFSMGSIVNPYFEAFAIFHLEPTVFEIGEAYVSTRALPLGFKIKAGKFKSDFGRINSKHHHSWNFDSQPLIYESLIGPEGISDPGIQVQWVAPTDTYIMAGFEAMQGTNAQSFGYIEKNNLYVGYLKSSVDIGEDVSILAGVSLAHGKNDTANSTDIYGVDLTLREQLGSYSSLVWQSEYLYRNKDIGTTSNNKQAGLYSELIYQHNNNWAGGIRYDAITKNSIDLSAYNGIDTNNLDKYSAMMEYKPFEMSRLRLQYTYDRSKIISGERKDINEVMLSLNIAIGAHSAHDY